MTLKFPEKIARKLGMADRGKHLAAGVIGNFVFRLIWTLSFYVTGIFLTRIIGEKSYGQYIYILAWVQVLIVPAMLGLDNLVVKEIASYKSKMEWGLFRGLLRRSTQGVFLVGTVLAILAGLVFSLILPHMTAIESEILYPFLVGMTIIPLFAYMRTRQSVIVGLDKVTYAHFSEFVLVPAVHLSTIALVVFLLKKEITTIHVIYYHIFAMAVAIVFAWLQARRYMPEQVKKAKPEYQTKLWMTSGLTMLLVSSVQILNSRIDVIMVGSFLGSAEAGIYNAANRGSTLILFIFVAVKTALSPLIASYHVNGEYDKLQSIVKKASRVSLAAALVPTLFIYIFGKWFLLLYSPEFVQGYIPLLIMSTAELIVVSFGALLVLLIMTGNTREALYGTLLSTILNIVLNIVLIPRYGMIGAAIALSSAHISSAVLMAYYVRKILKISPEAWSKSMV